MYFIHSGSVEIVSEEGDVVFAILDEGQFFGEICLFFDCPQRASIRAANNCDLFTLSKSDLYSTLSHYPDIMEQIHTIAARRWEMAKKHSVITTTAIAEGRSPTDAARIAARHTYETKEGMALYPQIADVKLEATVPKTQGRTLRGECKSPVCVIVLFALTHRGRVLGVLQESSAIHHLSY